MNISEKQNLQDSGLQKYTIEFHFPESKSRRFLAHVYAKDIEEAMNVAYSDHKHTIEAETGDYHLRALNYYKGYEDSNWPEDIKQHFHHFIQKEKESNQASKTLELTKLENSFLEALISSLYAEPGFSDVDVNDIAEIMKVTVNTCKGVLGSLVKKDIVWTSRDCTDGNFDIIYLEEEYYGLHPEWRESEHTKYKIQITNLNLNKRTMKTAKEVTEMNATQLRKYATEVGIKNSSKMKKAELLPKVLEIVAPAPKPKKTSKKKKPVNQFLDELLAVGGTWKELIKAADSYAKRYGGKRRFNAYQFKRHINYRRRYTGQPDYLSTYTVNADGIFPAK